jgi:heme A synthase
MSGCPVCLKPGESSAHESVGIFGAVLNSSRYNAGHHWFTVSVACLAFLLVLAGEVTSNNSGLSVPDWPTSFGSLTMQYCYPGEPAQVLRFERKREVVSA